MGKIMKLQNHPDYNPLYDSHPNTTNIFRTGVFQQYNLQGKVDALNSLYEKIGLPLHVSYFEHPGPRWQGKLYQLDFAFTAPEIKDSHEPGYYLPRGIQALDKIDIVRYLEHMLLYANYAYHTLSDKYRKSLPFSPELKNDMPF